MSRSRTLSFVVALVALWVSSSSTAHAFSVRSAFTRSCHETMTLAALVAAGDAIDLTQIPEPRTDDWETASRWALRDLDVALEDRRERFYYFSLLAGVRAPDTEGHSTANLDAVRAIHASPAGQYAHCLRAPEDDGPEGNARAARGCAAAFVEAALAARDAMSLEESRIRVPFALDHYGRVELEAWAPAYHLGRALHLLQDSFAHTVRTPDLHRIVHVMNFAEAVAGSLRRPRDGLPHSTATDRCDLGNAERVDAATEASSDLLVLTGTTPDRVTREGIDGFVARWLTLDANASECTLGNGLCDSPWLPSATRAPSEPVLGCAAGGGTDHAGWAAPMLAGLVLRAQRSASDRSRRSLRRGASARSTDTLRAFGRRRRAIVRSLRAIVCSLRAIPRGIGSWISGASAERVSPRAWVVAPLLALASCVAPLDRAPLEVYVIDDGSSDGVAARVLESLDHPSAAIDVSVVHEVASTRAEVDALLARWLEDADDRAGERAGDRAVDRDRVPRLLVTTTTEHASALEARACLPSDWQGLHFGDALDCPRVHVARLPHRAAGFLAGALAAEQTSMRVVVRDDGTDPEPLAGVVDGVAHVAQIAPERVRQLVLVDAKSDPATLVEHPDVWLAGRRAAGALVDTAERHDLRGDRARLVLLDPELDAARRPEVLAVVRVNLPRVLRHAVREAARDALAEGTHTYRATDGFVDVIYTGGRAVRDEDVDEDSDEDVDEDSDEDVDEDSDESAACWDPVAERALRQAADASAD
ncbi:MAG: hypothetical protein MUE69_04415 [Myxococcota bacterium]|jgi:hypothetical protein|nr:hypothetical protein [Myxococcota bacterium]